MEMRTRYAAAMVLSGVGDAIGFKNANWEFCRSGERIHQEANDLGGIEKLKVRLPNWPVSDDTVLHLATAEGLAIKSQNNDREALYRELARKYKEAMNDMKNRAAGLTTMEAVHKLKPGRERGYQIPFNPRGGGCGAAMRSMCIGLRYPRPEEIDKLVEISIESGRMTHHHPTGYLGSLAAALFTSYAIQGRPLNSWGMGLMETLPLGLEYIKRRGFCAKENVKEWDYFKLQWEKYLDERGLQTGQLRPTFPGRYGVRERDAFYKSVSFSGTAGASGHDAPMIAYDALLSSRGDWLELVSRSMLHGGDSDSTGVIAACCYGAMHGFAGVPECHYVKLEYRDRLEYVAKRLYDLARPESHM